MKKTKNKKRMVFFDSRVHALKTEVKVMKRVNSNEKFFLGKNGNLKRENRSQLWREKVFVN